MKLKRTFHIVYERLEKIIAIWVRHLACPKNHKISTDEVLLLIRALIHLPGTRFAKLTIKTAARQASAISLMKNGIIPAHAMP